MKAEFRAITRRSIREIKSTRLKHCTHWSFPFDAWTAVTKLIEFLSVFGFCGCYNIESMNDDGELLRRYVVNGSEAAFRELVERYLNLVYSAAVRQLSGDTHQAEDITQMVFTDLARKAGRLLGHSSLAGWLYTSVGLAVKTVRRTTERREQREKAAMHMMESAQKPEMDVDRLTLILDEGMHSLREGDRHAILLRFFQEKNFAAVGDSLGLNESAARKRVERALEKLRRFFERRGIAISGVALGEMLASEGVSAAPTGLAAIVAKSSVAAAATGTSFVFSFLKFMNLSKGMIAGTVITAGLTTGVLWQSQANSRLKQENTVLREQRARSVRQNEPAENPTNAPMVLSHDERMELLRLRGEVGLLKRQIANAAEARSRETVKKEVKPVVNWQDRPENQESIAKMRHAKVWMMALFRYARKNDGQFPNDFGQAEEFLTVSIQSNLNEGEAAPDTAVFQEATNRFEIVYHGSLNELSDWAKIMVIREKEPWLSPDGGWARTYAFADGHSEIHRAEDGNFERWEQQHRAVQ
jgi:RNA polymerase sigma factor (sigma-70 family)